MAFCCKLKQLVRIELILELNSTISALVNWGWGAKSKIGVISELRLSYARFLFIITIQGCTPRSSRGSAGDQIGLFLWFSDVIKKMITKNADFLPIEKSDIFQKNWNFCSKLFYFEDGL